jgi:hypothetical protein
MRGGGLLQEIRGMVAVDEETWVMVDLVYILNGGVDVAS